jgi:putative membrane protein
MRTTAAAGLAASLAIGLALAAAPVAAQQAARPLDDPTIVAIFDAANGADIETGRLAAERGRSKEVRDFGRMLVRDHEHVRTLGRDLAHRLGVTPTPPADRKAARDHAAAMARLRRLSGPAFDRAFLQHEASFHQAVIDAVQTTLLPAIRNAELKALVVQVAPAFQAHMLAARHLEAQLAGAKGASGTTSTRHASHAAAER